MFYIIPTTRIANRTLISRSLIYFYRRVVMVLSWYMLVHLKLIDNPHQYMTTNRNSIYYFFMRLSSRLSQTLPNWKVFQSLLDHIVLIYYYYTYRAHKICIFLLTGKTIKTPWENTKDIFSMDLQTVNKIIYSRLYNIYCVMCPKNMNKTFVGKKI